MCLFRYCGPVQRARKPPYAVKGTPQNHLFSGSFNSLLHHFARYGARPLRSNSDRPNAGFRGHMAW
jgi:hypothetical protein